MVEQKIWGANIRLRDKNLLTKITIQKTLEGDKIAARGASPS